MPWYYAGPEAKPVGPISLEELRAARASGVIKPETYIIEQSGQPVASLVWKKYQDVFPAAAATLPPMPPPMAPPPAVLAPPPAMQAHPLFPSATAAALPPQTFPATARPDPYYNIKRTNGWCGWGFGFGLAAFFTSFACGIGLFPALIAVLFCIIGLVQVHKRQEQAGQGLAIAGLILSVVALLISAIFIVCMAIPMIKAHELTVTEQTSNDSE